MQRFEALCDVVIALRFVVCGYPITPFLLYDAVDRLLWEIVILGGDFLLFDDGGFRELPLRTVVREIVSLASDSHHLQDFRLIGRENRPEV